MKQFVFILSVLMISRVYPMTLENLEYTGSVRATITASSTLDPFSSYGAGFLCDDSLFRAWVEGDRGQGIGSTIKITLEQSQDISVLYIANGYQRSASHFTKNSRPRAITVTINGTEIIKKTLKDNMEYQAVPLGFQAGVRTIEIRIDSVYPGTQYQDTCISEIKLGDDSSYRELQTSFEDELRQYFREQLAKHPFTAALDTDIVKEEKSTHPDIKNKKSYKAYFSSTGSFKIEISQWNSTQPESEIRELFKDLDNNGGFKVEYDVFEDVFKGNWSIASQSGNKIVLKIYGLHTESSKRYWEAHNAYTSDGGWTDSKTKKTESLFSDTLTITVDGNSKNIRSQRFLLLNMDKVGK